MCAETTTAKYAWTKPDPGASSNTWGSTLNATTDKIDAQVWANQQAGLPVGSGALWFTATAPTNWLICDGRSLNTTTYAALFAVIQYTYGGSGANFNLPNPLGRTVIGAGSGVALASQGGEAAHVLSVAEMPSHAHPGSSQAAHNHPTSYQDAHTHAASQDDHTHGDFGHGHGVTASQDAHTHNFTGSMAGAAPGGGSALVNAGQSTTTGASANAVYVSIATGYANLGGSTANGVYIDNRQPALHIDTQQPAVTVAAQGSGAAHNNWPPYLAINFIIRFQ